MFCVAMRKSFYDLNNFTKQLRYAIDGRVLYGVTKTVCL